ncbi:hypothetical protein TWF481_000609 [Arthrobotrys musiformis]|uniref:Uncharacterized protein n=1 Tax=Arthrobotrys musiformis TaxID=47236 RepID=A0AAV9WNE8_9PEZI
MYLANILPILSLASSIASLAVPAENNNGAEVAGQQNPAKRGDPWEIPGATGSGTTPNIDITKLVDGQKAGEEDKGDGAVVSSGWPILAGPGPAIIDPEEFPPVVEAAPVGESIKNRRSLVDSEGETLLDIVEVPPEQVAQWMGELETLLSKRSLPTKRSHIRTSRSHSGGDRKASGNLAKRTDSQELVDAWYGFGGGSPNDYRLIFDPAHSGFVDEYASSGDSSWSEVNKPANQKRGETGALLKAHRSINEKRAKALEEILVTLNDQQDLSRTSTEVHNPLERRAPVSVPKDVKPVQDEVIRRLFKLYQNKYKRDLQSRQSPQEVTEQILQTLFQFKDDEEWKWNLPSASTRRRWSEFPPVEEISEGPEKRSHLSDGVINTDDPNPSTYAWPDISLKVREVLPPGADEVSQRIIVTIFRMQENFRHKRSVTVEVKEEVKEITIKRRDSASDYFYRLLAELLKKKHGGMRMWILRQLQNRFQKDVRQPQTNLERRTRYSTLPVVSPSDLNKKKKLFCLRQKGCRLPWNVRRLQSSTVILKRIVDSIDKETQSESEIIKRDVANDVLAWLQNISKWFDQGKTKNRKYKSSSGISPRSTQLHDGDFVAELIKMLRRDKDGNAVPDPGHDAAWHIISGVLGAFSPAPTQKRDITPRSRFSSVWESIKLAFQRKVIPVKKIKQKFQPRSNGNDKTLEIAPAGKLKKRYDPESYPWWSGSSEDSGGEARENPWIAGGSSCARLRSSSCLGVYKRSVGSSQAARREKNMAKRNPNSGLENLRKRIAKDDKIVSKKQAKLLDRSKAKKGKKRKQALTTTSISWNDGAGYLRLDPFGIRRKLGGLV